MSTKHDEATSGIAGEGFGVLIKMPGVVAFFLLSVINIVILGWLYLLPKYRRENLAAGLGYGPWAWYSNLCLFGIKSRIIGKEHLPRPYKNFVFVSNHESVADIWLLIRYLRPGFLMKSSMLTNPIGWGGLLTGCVPVDRDNKDDRKRSIDATLDMARRARPVLVFPEGTFGHLDGRLREPHLNLVRHAFDVGMSVVPLAHAGGRRCVDGDVMPVRRGAEVVLIVRPVMHPKEFANRDAFADAVWQSVIEGVREARASVPPGAPYVADPAAQIAA